jgi:crotonobetainyl-CoA:carnitine CoA-transferase CaiB-like acyl-CoA transferase
MSLQDRAADAQTAPLEGFRVLEMAMYGSAPSAGAVLAGWGADVIKIEHAASGEPGPVAETADRGKRSLGLDMTKAEGREVLYGLAARSDVFLTGFPPSARHRFGIDVADLRRANPRIVYATGGMALDPRGLEELGDTLSGTNLAVGISAALLRRERTGEPSVVDASSAHSPMPGLYRTADGRYMAFDVAQRARRWPEVCRHIDRPELADDPRFRTAEQFAGHTREAVALVREALATRTLAEWTERFAALSGPWADGPSIGAGELPPSAAQTERILMDLGLDWDRIIALMASGAVT